MATLFCGDCLEIMPTIPAGSIDAIITDLPYGTTVCKWDTIIPFDDLWRVVKHVLKPRGAFVTTASQPFTSALVMSNPKWFRYEWIWKKSRKTGFLDCSTRPLKNHENVLVFYDKQPTYNPEGVTYENRTAKRSGRGRSPDTNGKTKTIFLSKGKNYPSSVLEFKNPQSSHPTQKPVALYEYLIKTYTNEGETVLDMCMGSGTTGVAAKNTRREFIGIEKDPIYFEIAKQRIEET